MRISRLHTVYALSAAAWFVFCGWQVAEHLRLRQSARAALLNRAIDISRSLGAVIRSQRLFISQRRLEEALREIALSSELVSVALLNSQGDVVVAAGEPIDFSKHAFPSEDEDWEGDTVAFRNLVDLGVGLDDRLGSRTAPIVMPNFPDAGSPPFGGSREPPPEKPQGTYSPPGAGGAEQSAPPPRMRFPRWDVDWTTKSKIVRWEIPLLEGATADFEKTTQSVVLLLKEPNPGNPPAPPAPDPSHDRERGGLRRPPWMSEARFQELSSRQGVHDFILIMSSAAFRVESARDFWLRVLSGAIALMAVGGLGVAWRSAEQSARLQLRLIRASEMNSHLREMNIAAAGLAHETRNPLNIVRGLAQIISKEPDVSSDTHARSRNIIEEVDRVTCRLNEFIEYSKPREAKPAPIELCAVVRDLERALESDLEEKSVRLDIVGQDLVVEADESLLRQVFFNLLLNAIQAVAKEGRVEVTLKTTGPGEAMVEVRDNGPGVPPEQREEIFRPYFTTNANGTGLGLAVVRQIVLAHHWEIAYVPAEGGGACFRITGLKLAGKAS